MPVQQLRDLGQYSAAGLRPYHKGEDITPLLKNLYDNLDANNGYSMALHTGDNPLPMRTLLVDDCIEKGLDFYNGGTRYTWSIINFSGMINVIDGLLVVRVGGHSEYFYRLNDELKRMVINRTIQKGV